jgi:hypothetical protein
VRVIGKGSGQSTGTRRSAVRLVAVTIGLAQNSKRLDLSGDASFNYGIADS